MNIMVDDRINDSESSGMQFNFVLNTSHMFIMFIDHHSTQTDKIIVKPLYFVRYLIWGILLGLKGIL